MFGGIGEALLLSTLDNCANTLRAIEVSDSKMNARKDNGYFINFMTAIFLNNRLSVTPLPYSRRQN